MHDMNIAEVYKALAIFLTL